MSERLNAAKQALYVANVMTRELMLEYGRALTEEIDRLEGVVAAAKEAAYTLENYRGYRDGVAHILQFLPHKASSPTEERPNVVGGMTVGNPK